MQYTASGVASNGPNEIAEWVNPWIRPTRALGKCRPMNEACAGLFEASLAPNTARTVVRPKILPGKAVKNVSAAQRMDDPNRMRRPPYLSASQPAGI